MSVPWREMALLLGWYEAVEDIPKSPWQRRTGERHTIKRPTVRHERQGRPRYRGKRRWQYAVEYSMRTIEREKLHAKV